MTTGFELRSTPTFRDLQGRFARANRQLLEHRRDMMRELGGRYVELAGEEAPGGAGRTVANQVGYMTFNDGETVGFRTRLGPIAKYHVTGTGIYGPRGTPIVPVRARVLHFYIGGQEFFRHSVRGVHPDAYLGRAYRRWLPAARSELRRISLRWQAEVTK